ncbi:MAG TPA: archaeosine biosynthesis radical SAM protein RaSEA [Candidatus Thermoplasmatota archaeon]|nr:archaeosine biosynthesis radical SAM protein RaSEA [Candidatus Thermoplasmatota archaeon]
MPSPSLLSHPQTLNAVMRDVRGLAPREGSLEHPTKVWTEPERHGAQVLDALVVILKTRGCTWALSGGCTMCGYVNDSMVRKVEARQLLAQFRRALAESHRGQPIVKIYTSGSFLDPTEVPDEAQAAILAEIPPGVRKVTLEAQSVHATDARVAAVRAALRPEVELEIAFGLESARPAILQYSVNKHDTFGDFVAACRACRAHGVRTKAYLLVKPPFLTEREALEDAVATTLAAGSECDVVSLNACNVQSRTLVERLWKRGLYRPIWLWSLVEIIRRTHGKIPARIRCDPVGAGGARGAHNCGACDKRVLEAIEAYSLTARLEALEIEPCACVERWQDTLELEGFLQGGAMA